MAALSHLILGTLAGGSWGLVWSGETPSLSLLLEYDGRARQNPALVDYYMTKPAPTTIPPNPGP